MVPLERSCGRGVWVSTMLGAHQKSARAARPARHTPPPAALLCLRPARQDADYGRARWTSALPEPRQPSGCCVQALRDPCGVARTLLTGEEKPHRSCQVVGLLVTVDCRPPLLHTTLRILSPAHLGTLLLPTTSGPPLKLRPHGHQSSRSLFCVSVGPMCQSHAVSMRPDTLRRCCSVTSWRIALLSPGRETCVRSPCWARP